MAKTNNQHDSIFSVSEMNYELPNSMRETFSNWLSDTDDNRFSPQASVICLDKISEYAERKKISCSVWDIYKPSSFKVVYQKIMNSKLLRVMERDTYNTFVVVGKLYMKFLKEKPWKKTSSEETEMQLISSITVTNEKKEVSETFSNVKTHNTNIDVIKIIEENNFKYVDKRDVGGALWIVGGFELYDTMQMIAKYGFQFKYKSEGVRSTKYKSAWWYKPETDAEALIAKTSQTTKDAKEEMEKIGKHTEFSDIIKIIEENNFKYVDKRDVGGALWIVGGFELYDTMQMIAKYGFQFKYKSEGVRSTKYKSAWWYKPHTDTATPRTYQYEGTYRNERNDIANNISNNKIINIIATKFKNGYRKSSSIDFERFKNYYYEEYGEEFQYVEDFFNNILLTEAFIYDDRVYIYNQNVIDSVFAHLEQMDSPCIFIDNFFEKNSSKFYNFNIFSVEMLRAFIEKYYQDISIKWNYILLQDNTTPSDLIKEVFEERETWSLEELHERLPCLKMDTIRQTMNSSDYFRVDKGTYTHIDNMDLPDSEGEKIVKFVENELNDKEYVNASEIDFSMFDYLNPYCSFSAIRDAVFYKFLSGKYQKNGNIITKIGEKLRVLDILERYCIEAETVSFDELNNLEAVFDPEGRAHSQCLIAGHNTMIRVSSDLFVSDFKVKFDVLAIDETIELYCHGNYMPLRGVTDFSLLPYVGYPWNLYLLESYLRRFSCIFKYDSRAVNSSNIGAIVRKSYNYNDYDDILAHVLAKSLVNLNDKTSVGIHLFDNGYIGWRNLGRNEKKIITSAKALREGGLI